MHRVKSHMHRFHRDQSGAILVLMLAAFLILMMIAWTVYDSGDVAREKVKLQAAADTAAMSQASIKARSMNMLAYTNVSKRSIFAIHSVYLSHFLAYADWAALVRTIGEFACRYIETSKGSEACNKIKVVGEQFVNIWKVEMVTDFTAFSGHDLRHQLGLEAQASSSDTTYLLTDDPTDFVSGLSFEAIADALFRNDWTTLVEGLQDSLNEVMTLIEFDGRGGLTYGTSTFDNWSGYSTHYYAQDIKALDNYQRYIAGVTPWWAWTEQAVKGMRNGATATVSFPRPLGSLPSGTDLTRMVAGAGGGNVSMGGTILADTLPVRPGDGPVFEPGDGREHGRLTMAAEIKRQLEEGREAFGHNLEQVLKDAVGAGSSEKLSFSANSGAFFIEYLGNLLVASVPVTLPGVGRTTYPRIPDSNAFINFIADAGFAALVALRADARLMDGGLETVQEIFDNHLRDYTASPWVLQHYKSKGSWLTNSSNLIFAYSNRAELFNKSRTKFDTVDKDYERSFLFDSIYRSSGYWTLAKSELSFQGEGPPSMWEAAWTGRMRPVTLPDEYRQAGYSLNDAYHDVLPTLGLIASLNLSQFDPLQVVRDLVQMERASRAAGQVNTEGMGK